MPKPRLFNTLRPRRNRRHFADDIFKCILMNENVKISIKFSLKSVPRGPINNIPALVQIMAWRRSCDKPLSEPMMVSLLTHICVTRPQWVKVGKRYELCIIWIVWHSDKIKINVTVEDSLILIRLQHISSKHDDSSLLVYKIYWNGLWWSKWLSLFCIVIGLCIDHSYIGSQYTEP